MNNNLNDSDSVSVNQFLLIVIQKIIHTNLKKFVIIENYIMTW